MHTLLTVSVKAINNLIQPNYCSICYRRIPFTNQTVFCEQCLQRI